MCLSVFDAASRHYNEPINNTVISNITTKHVTGVSKIYLLVGGLWISKLGKLIIFFFSILEIISLNLNVSFLSCKVD